MPRDARRVWLDTVLGQLLLRWNGEPHDCSAASARLPAAAARRAGTLFCCLPFGIVAIVKSSQVSGLYAQGRYAEAQASADSARKWIIWSVVIGIIADAVAIAVNVAAMNTDTSAAAMMLLGF